MSELSTSSWSHMIASEELTLWMSQIWTTFLSSPELYPLELSRTWQGWSKESPVRSGVGTSPSLWSAGWISTGAWICLLAMQPYSPALTHLVPRQKPPRKTQYKNPSSVHLPNPVTNPNATKQSRTHQRSSFHGILISSHGWSQQGRSKIPSSSWALYPAVQGQNFGYLTMPNLVGQRWKSQPCTASLCHWTHQDDSGPMGQQVGVGHWLCAWGGEGHIFFLSLSAWIPDKSFPRKQRAF